MSAQWIRGGVLFIGMAANFAVGYVLGRSSEQSDRQVLIQDAVTSKSLVGIQKNLVTLTLIRDGKSVIPDLELWVSSQFQAIESSAIIKGSASDFMLRRVAASLSAYRARHPDTALDPARDPNVAKVLSYDLKRRLELLEASRLLTAP
jgi:hypothetical protein